MPEEATKDGAVAPCSAAHLFKLLWDAMADVLGTSGTAALLRRSAKHCAATNPVLEGLIISRTGYVYTYELPPVWNEPHRPAPHPSFGHLVHELLPLLSALTGAVVVRRIQSLAEFQRCGLVRGAS